MDYEYKKYVLLAYLKDIRNRFNRSQLYPFMSDLVFHYRNLVNVKANKELLYDNFPKTLSQKDFQKLKLTYEQLIHDSEMMGVIQEILEFALPRMKKTLEEGRELFEFVEENIDLSPVGVTPIYANEGYLLVNQDKDKRVSVFRYNVMLFEKADEKYRSLNTRYIGEEIKSISNTYESIKLQLTKTFTDLPNPATYLAISKIKFPVQETVLPVAKRMLVRKIS